MKKALSYHTVAKLITVVSAYLLHFFLGKVMSVPEYGIVGTLISFYNFYYMFLTNGIRQGVSKNLAKGECNRTSILRRGFLIQMIFSAGLAILNYAVAPIVAELIGDLEYANYFRMISFLIPLTALYFVFAGSLNGLKLFLQEAILVSVYPILRMLGIPLIVISKNDKVACVMMGFIMASLLSAGLGFVFLITRKNKDIVSETVVSYRTLIVSSCDFIVFFSSLSLILNLDTFILQYVVKDAELTGYYTGAHTFSLVPYYLVSAFYLVILPYVTEQYKAEGFSGVRNVVSKYMNIIFVLIFPVVILISVSSSELMMLFYNETYIAGSMSLRILSCGTFLLSVSAVLCVVLNGIDCKKNTNQIALLAVVVDLVLLLTLSRKIGITGTAIATTATAIIVVIISTITLIKNVGNPFDVATICKITGITMLVAGIYKLVTHFVIVKNVFIYIGICVLMGALYLLLAYFAGIWNVIKEEWK